MRAIVQKGYGDPERVLHLREVPDPEPGPGEVLVRVVATKVNTPDWIATLGVPSVLRLVNGLRTPVVKIRGSDVAGVVEAVGPGVEDLSPGDEVLGSTWTNSLRSGHGTFAELTVAPAGQLARKPAALGFEEAAALVMSGVTALLAVRDEGQVGKGTRLLINGASGGVGTFAVQIAVALGAEVTGVCSGRNVDLVRSLGAAEVVDYTTTDVRGLRRRFDVVLDNACSHPPRAMAVLLAEDGILLPNSVGPTDTRWQRLVAGLPRMVGAAMLRTFRGVDVRFTTCEATTANLHTLLEMWEAKDLDVVVDQTVTFEHAATAVARMASHRARGNVVIRVEDNEIRR